MGAALARNIHWKFVDIDVEIEKHIGKSIKDYVKETSWSAFREQEQLFLLKALDYFNIFEREGDERKSNRDCYIYWRRCS